MKIINRKTFLGMPEGTLYSKYAPFYFENFEIKGKFLPANNFYSQSIIDAVALGSSKDSVCIFQDSKKTNISFNLDFNCKNKNGSFEKNQLFAIWERADVGALIEKLKEIEESLK